MTAISVNEVYAIGAPIVLAMIFFEILVSNFQNQNFYKRSDTLCTIGLLLGNIIVAFAIKGTVLAFHIYLYQFRAFDFVNQIPIWALWIITFISIDLVFYIYHNIFFLRHSFFGSTLEFYIEMYLFFHFFKKFLLVFDLNVSLDCQKY